MESSQKDNQPSLAPSTSTALQMDVHLESHGAGPSAYPFVSQQQNVVLSTHSSANVREGETALSQMGPGAVQPNVCMEGMTWPLVYTPFGYLPIYGTPDINTYQFDPVSGYFKDASSTGFYYDQKTGLFYDPNSSKWMFWSAKLSTFINCEGSDSELRQKMREEERVAQTSQNQTTFTVVGVEPAQFSVIKQMFAPAPLLSPPVTKWDKNERHDLLSLDVDCLIVESKGGRANYRSIMSENPTDYYEITIMQRVGMIYIGFNTTKTKKKRTQICDYWQKMPLVGPRDVIGCGRHGAALFYTMNGGLLATAQMFVRSAEPLYACISMTGPADKIEANFGAEAFEFKIIR